MSDQFFIPMPTPTGKTKPNPTGGAELPTYVSPETSVFSSHEMMWSGKGPLPAIGDEIHVVMNNIGKATVKGYLASRYGFLGLMVLPHSPPAYLVKQREEDRKAGRFPDWWREGIICVYGMEIQQEEPAKETA